jgi:hypothetical protein
MKKLSLVFVALVVLTLAPSAMACALCDGENCQWGMYPDYFAIDCWYDFCPPCGCFTTGHCQGPSAQLNTDLAMEYRIASVEIRQGQGDVLVAQKTEKAPAVVAEKKPIRK